MYVVGRQRFNLNPTPPSIRGLIKINKTDCPIRPIVNWVGAPAYKLAKKHVNVISTYQYTLAFIYNVNNSMQLTDEISNIPYNPNLRIASFDISNMYTNIPTDQLPDIINHLCVLNNAGPNIQSEIKNYVILFSRKTTFS